MTTWKACMIASDAEYDGAPRLRHEFTLDAGHGPLQSAWLTVSALGVCEVELNGRPVSSDLLTPGWSSYEWRVRYREYEVTDLLKPHSAIGFTLGNGWYRGRLGWSGDEQVYGTELAAFGELRILFSDGHEQVIATDHTWSSGPSPVTANDLYDGQSIDARRSSEGWSSPGFPGEGWTGVHVVDFDTKRLQPAISPPVRAQEEVLPVRSWRSPTGSLLLDFGQNLVGWLRVRTYGSAGDVIRFRHAEVLEGGELGVRPLRSAKATDEFTLSGRDDTFEPTFTFHGFRYVEVDGWPGSDESLTDGSIRAVVISSDLERTGTFRSSDPLLNQLHDNIVWSLRGNFVDLPTDCPQRDERVGWTGDIAAFAPTAAFLFDTKDFLQDWLADLALEQRHNDGIVPIIVPDMLKFGPPLPGFPEKSDAAAFWSDAAVWVPWALYNAYGDSAVLEAQFESMTAHARRVQSLLSPSGVWDSSPQFGDWLDPDAAPHEPWNAKADSGVVATACAYRTALLVAQTAGILGLPVEEQEFSAMANGLRAAFRDQYVADEKITSDCTTVYTLAVVFGLLDDAELGWAGQRLSDLVAESGFLISTGFAGTPFICEALSRSGHTATAYRLLMQQECPSWLYPVTMGATTIWERWDSMLPDGTVNPGEMTSFNHYAFGAVADWIHRTVGGIAPLEPGYRRILIAPQPGGGLTWAETTLKTAQGLVAVRWQIDGGNLRLDADIPEGSTALLLPPGGGQAQELSAGQHRAQFSLPLTAVNA